MIARSRLMRTTWIALVWVALSLTFWSPSLCAQTAPLPAGERVEREPVTRLSPLRGQIVLNGLWRFMPAAGPAAAQPTGAWGWVRVPGSWETRADWAMFNLDGVIAPGTGPAWAETEFKPNDANDRSRSGMAVTGVNRAWYQREIHVPADWAGRSIVANFERVSTDARIWVDDKEVGALHWPGGEIDLSNYVKPGQTHTLRLFVAAVADEREVEQWMDSDFVIRHPAALDTRGITGDVILHSRPAGPRIDSLFAHPSVKDRTLVVNLELAGQWPGGAYRASVIAREWPSGQEARRWTVDVADLDSATRSFTLSWPEVRLWEIGAPALYELEVALAPQATPDRPVDVLTQRIGFRDFRIVGRDFYLNGSMFRMRPALFSESAAGGNLEIIAATLRRSLAEGYNVLEIWPNDDQRRGKPSFRALIASVADEVGIGILMPNPSVDSYWGDITRADPPEDQLQAWRMAAVHRVREVRNSPSVLAYLFHANRFLTYDDQNPRRIGNQARLTPSAAWEREVAPARRHIEWLKTLDPSRPVTSHANSNVGDFQTSNNYLGLLPLQEREEWLSEWAESGDLPYMAVEFISPFSADMNRSRRGWDSGASEQLLTEHAAAQLGASAYALEDADYRASIASALVEGQNYQGRLQGQHPLFQELSEANTRRIWRSWRTWGISGGMIPWDGGYASRRLASGSEQVALNWKPGDRGTRLSYTTADLLDATGRHREVTPNGVELERGLAPTLAYLAGPAERWVAKDHNFKSGELIEKSVILINDSRQPQPYNISLTLPEKTAAIKLPRLEGTLAIGEILKLPLRFRAPAVTTVTDAVITLAARIGVAEHSDRLALHFHPAVAPRPATRPLALFDPIGDTAALLARLGQTPVRLTSEADFKAQLAAGRTLLVGRDALVDRAAACLDLGEFVAAGGRAVLFAQNPEWLRGSAGMRVHQWLGRKFWPVATQATHPVLAGLDAGFFRDWRGSGSLVPPTAHVDVKGDPQIYPTYGWRWGSRGSVSSAAWEKPHRSGWTPLLEGEFDLAYSPLLELRHGSGLLVYCGLDLEARGDVEPAADTLLLRVLDHAGTATTEARRRIAYLGGEATSLTLAAVGVEFVTISDLDVLRSDDILVLGQGATPNQEVLTRWISSGGRVLALPGTTGKIPLGFTSRIRSYAQTPTIPAWPELRGLGLSDLRYRVDQEIPLLNQPPEAGEISANGLLGRIQIGKGVAVVAMLDPLAFDDEKLTYLRFSRWRHTRALAQILANLGAAFPADTAFFQLKTDIFRPLDLTGTWLAKEEVRLPSAASPTQGSIDPGNEGFKLGWHDAAHPTTDWSPISLPDMLREGSLVDWEKANGAVWFRRTITLPADWRGRGDLRLYLGNLDDYDVTFFNGVRVGGTGKDKADSWNIPRIYKVPAWVIKPGQPNVIAVRIFNQFGGGGFGAPKAEFALRLELAKPVDSGGLYVPGFRHDREFGDDPARYVRW